MQCRRPVFDPWKIPWRRWGRYPGEGNGYSLQYSCLQKFHGQRSLVGYSPQSCKDSDMTERLTIQKISSVQLFSHVLLFATPWTAAHQASLFVTNYWSLLKFMSIKLVMPSNHLIHCCAILLLPSIFPIIGVFSNESVLYIRWPNYWSFDFSISQNILD